MLVVRPTGEIRSLNVILFQNWLVAGGVNRADYFTRLYLWFLVDGLKIK